MYAKGEQRAERGEERRQDHSHGFCVYMQKPPAQLEQGIVDDGVDDDQNIQIDDRMDSPLPLLCHRQVESSVKGAMVESVVWAVIIRKKHFDWVLMDYFCTLLDFFLTKQPK